MPKDRGAEQGDVDGLECSLALGMVAAEARRRGCRTAGRSNPPVDQHTRPSRHRKTSIRTREHVSGQTRLFLTVKSVKFAFWPLSTHQSGELSHSESKWDLASDAAGKTFEVGQRSRERLFPGFTEDSTEQAAFSHNARLAHLGPLIAAKPHILDVVRGAATAGLLSEQPLLARLDTQLRRLPPPSSTPFDDSENPTAQLYLQKEAQAADVNRGSKQCKDRRAEQSRTQQFQVSNGVAPPPSMMTTTPNLHVLHPEEVGCLTEPDCDALRTLSMAASDEN